MPPRRPARSVCAEVLLGHEVVDGDDHRHARVQQRAGHPGRVEEVVAAARLAALDDLAVALGAPPAGRLEQAARVAPDAARVRRRPGVEADPHVGDPYPFPLASRPACESVLRRRLGRAARGPRAVGLGAPPRAAAGRGPRGRAGARPRLRRGPLRRRAARRRRRSGRGRPRRGGARARAPQRARARSCARSARRAIPLEDASVDLVWCSEVLEHVPDTAGLLSEVRRVLTTGGRLLATTPSHTAAARASRCCAGTRTSTRSASTCASTAAARSPRTLDDVRVRGRRGRGASAACSSPAPARRASSSSRRSSRTSSSAHRTVTSTASANWNGWSSA